MVDSFAVAFKRCRGRVPADIDLTVSGPKALLEKRRAGVFISGDECRVRTLNMIATKRKRLADKNTE